MHTPPYLSAVPTSILIDPTSGIAGGVVQSKYFQIQFGVRPPQGPADQSRIDNVSANVVSVLQAGAFFGSLGSAPVSGMCLYRCRRCSDEKHRTMQWRHRHPVL